MKVSLGSWVRYKFDNFMAKGIGSMLFGLVVIFLASLGLIVALRAIVFFGFQQGDETFRGQYQNEASHLTDGSEMDTHFFHHIYLTFLQMTDGGNMAQDILAHPAYKVPAVIGGMVGLVLMSALVGLITTWLMERMAQLRKGTSQVIEANESEKDATVCILAEADKEEMDDFLAFRLPAGERATTRIVTRSGSISSIANLQVASVETCKSVILLASCNQSAADRDKQLSDARVLKSILALTNCVPSSKGTELNIVAEVFDPTQKAIIERTCPHPVSVIDAWDILAKIIVQTSRSVGLSVVYGEILSFEGCEMYFYNNPKWKGMTFGDVQFHFPDGVPLGVRNTAGEVLINPASNHELKGDDDLLIVASDDSAIQFKKKPVAKPVELEFVESRIDQKIERELIIGWNRMAPIIIEQYADYVLDGSEITILIEDPPHQVIGEIDVLRQSHPGLKIDLVDGDPFDMGVLNGVMPPNKNNIIILNKSGESRDAEQTDSETIVILLMLRAIFEEAKLDPLPSLIAEVADSRNQSLVSSSGVKDFIISNRLVSMLLAQISEEADIKSVYDNLFEEDGSEIYLKPLSLYQKTFGKKLTFADCMSLAQKRGEVCIGVKIKSEEENEDANFGVELIPDKKKHFHLGAEDCLVVVAEDEC